MGTSPLQPRWQSGLLQPKPPQSHAWPTATCPREAPRWPGALGWLWGTEPGSRTGAPDHFSNSRFRFSFESGCVRVRPIFIPSSDSEPGFQFLLSHCTEGEGLYSPLGLRCVLPHHQKHPHRVISHCHSFGKVGHSSRCPRHTPLALPRAPGAPSWLSRRCHSHFHPETGSFCPRRVARRHARSLSALPESPGCQSRVTSFPAWLPAARGSAVSSPGRAARDGDVQSICSFPVFIHVGWKNVFMRRVAVALCHGPFGWALFPPADELDLSMCCAVLAWQEIWCFLLVSSLGEEGVIPPALVPSLSQG